MPEKVKGSVKWFSNKRGFGFVSPETGGPDVFLHHSKIVSDAEYKTLREGLEVEFEIGTDEEGKPFADKVTSVGGSPIPPPDRRNKPKKGGKKDEGADEAPAEKGSSKKGGDASGGTDGAGEKKDKGKGGRNQKKKFTKKPASGGGGGAKTWYSELDEDVQKSIEGRSIKIESGRAFVSLGDARLKIGTGGYITLAHASGLIAEGTYTCSKDGKLAPTWSHVLKLDGQEWAPTGAEAANGVLLKEINLKDESVTATGDNETPDSLWGEGKPDPKDALEKNGFQMRKVALTAAANPGRRGRGQRDRKRGGKPEAAAAT